MRIDRKTIQISLVSFGLLLILSTYFIYPLIKEKTFKAEQVFEENIIETETNKYLGEWASSKLGKKGLEKQNYIDEIIKADMEEAGSEDVFRKLKKDFEAASIPIEDSEIRNQMEKALVAKNESEETTTFENIKYKGETSDNTFTIKSEKANILSGDPDIVYMDNMHVTIFLKDRTVVIISDKGRYNKANYNIFFENNVEATDGETVLYSDNLDLISAEEKAIVYNGVRVIDEKSSLLADKIHYDFETKFYRISMFNNEKVKVKLVE